MINYKKLHFINNNRQAALIKDRDFPILKEQFNIQTENQFCL